FLRANAANYALAILAYFVASFASQLGLLFCCVGIFPAVFWATSSWPTASATPSASSRRADGSRRMPETPEGRTRVRWTLVALLALYAATRLPGLSLLPPFLDEDQAVHWSLLIAEGQKLERPWNYGKGLSVFLTALVFLASRAAAAEPVLVGRCVTIVAGAVTLLAMVAIARRLDGETAAVLAGIFYLFCPFTLFYDRLALTDPFVSTFGALVLLASLRLADAPDIRRALLAALALVLGVLAKTVGMLLFVVPAAVFLLLRPRPPALARPVALTYAAATAAVAYPLLRFFETTSTVRLGVSHEDVDLVTRLVANLRTSAGWLWTYWTPPLAVLALVALVPGPSSRPRPAWLLALLVAVPVLAFSAVSTLWFPRYLL